VTLLGYTVMCEQTGLKQLVCDVALGEQAGFHFAVISDRFFRGWRPKATPRTQGACSAWPPDELVRASLYLA
jgi:hypothetical protein